MSGLPKIAFSKTLESASWANTTLLGGDPVQHVTRLKEQPGGDMIVLGSGLLASALLRAGLIDEYRLIVSPVLLGSGRPMLPGLDQRIRLRLVGVRQFASGVVLLCY